MAFQILCGFAKPVAEGGGPVGAWGAELVIAELRQLGFDLAGREASGQAEVEDRLRQRPFSRTAARLARASNTVRCWFLLTVQWWF